MNRSVVLGCVALTTMAACANRQDASVNATTVQVRGDDNGNGNGNDQGNVGVTVANYMIARWPNLQLEDSHCTDCFSLNYAAAVPGPSPKYWEYTNGVPLYGIQKLYERTNDPAYFNYVKQWVDYYVAADGTINYGTPPTQTTSKNDPRIQDTMQPASLLPQLYDATGDPKYLNAMKNARAVFDIILQNSAGAFWHKPNYARQQWLDAIFMSEPFITRYGALYAEQVKPGDSAACFQTSTTQIKLADAVTFDPQKSLHHHAWNGDEAHDWTLNLPNPATGALQGCGLCTANKIPPTTGTRVSPILWARSIGWYVAAIVDVLEFLPQQHPDRAKLEAIVGSIAEGLKTYQDPTSGLWFQIVDAMDGPVPAEGGYPNEGRAAQPNFLETSASALFVYALAKAERLGIFHGNKYHGVAKRGWAGVKSKVVISGDQVTIKDTVVGLSVGGTWNAYTNVSPPSDVVNGINPQGGAECTGTGYGGSTFKSPPLTCRYAYVRDNVPQGFGAVMLAASEMEF
jgi:unsaturated rhamnogalacturonyl hydrolase